MCECVHMCVCAHTHTYLQLSMCTYHRRTLCLQDSWGVPLCAFVCGGAHAHPQSAQDPSRQTLCTFVSKSVCVLSV